ncbi:MAG: G5 domain-containing protein, partial [Moorella sp. (in: Bacteria)]|nr:G5 domain-containing protein [Moorella sp. (in: firmicutes)]
EIQTCRSTVGDVLKEQGIPLNPADIVEPAPDSPVREGTQIKVVRVRSEEEIREVPLARPTRREADPHLARGLSRVVQAGKDGLEKQRWLIVYHDGQEVERRLVERTVLKEPVERVIRVGALQQVSRGGQNIRFSRALDVVATAYTYTGYNTASGSPPHFGVAAVDPGVIPMGSRLYVEGYGFARALDKGSAIKGERIDVFFETREQARRWGVRRVRVYILE